MCVSLLQVVFAKFVKDGAVRQEEKEKKNNIYREINRRQ